MVMEISVNPQEKLRLIYNDFLKSYGKQGWWPILELHSRSGKNPTKTGSLRGYHPGDYSFPKNRSQQFEICIGAILTQNTAWPNVEKAILNLDRLSAMDPTKIISMSETELKGAIRPAGYYNQKAKKLRIFSQFYLELKGSTPSRQELMELWGIGPETADSILLYAFKVPTFVVDGYTKKILAQLGILNPKASYDEIKETFESAIKPDLAVYQEFHALIVEHGKREGSKKE
jgi:endonuclease III related protein